MFREVSSKSFAAKLSMLELSTRKRVHKKNESTKRFSRQYLDCKNHITDSSSPVCPALPRQLIKCTFMKDVFDQIQIYRLMESEWRLIIFQF